MYYNGPMLEPHLKYARLQKYFSLAEEIICLSSEYPVNVEYMYRLFFLSMMWLCVAISNQLGLSMGLKNAATYFWLCLS